jgi:hypothetical protein
MRRKKMEAAMSFLVQFIRFRRGTPEIIRTLPVAAENAQGALERARGVIGTASWPPQTEALRVMDGGGRTLLDWKMLA